MKIAYTIDNTSKNINISKSDLDNKVLVSWADKSSQMASLELTANGIKEYLQSPSRLISEGNNIYITLDKENMMTYSGIGIYNPKIFKNIEISKYKLINILLKEIKNNRVSGIIHKNIWYDIGDNKKLKKVSNLFF